MKRRWQYFFVFIILWNYLKIEAGNKNLLLSASPNLVDKWLDIENILTETRTKIKHELRNYNFTHSGVDKLEDLLTESGGKPVTSLILSTWRSGSTFLGDLLNAMPSNFYSYEPLILFRVKQIRGPPHAENVTGLIKNMLKCNFSDSMPFFNYTIQFQNKRKLFDECKANITELCLDANFTSRFCKLFPFQSMKLVRFRLHLLGNILEDETLNNVKMVFLIRDPRGVMQSRFTEFCNKPDCSSPKVLCDDMFTDYVAAKQLLKKYPNRLTVLRFEDLVLNLNETTHQLLKFLGLGYTSAIDDFLNTHTRFSDNQTFSTFRISKDIPFKWKNLMTFEYVEKLQEVCKEAMKLWGYQPAHNALHMTSIEFNPILPYRILSDE